MGVLYILDEPSIGLHQRDNARLIATMERLRDLGNTVIVVEHDEETIRAADFVVDMGPGAGEHGGEIVCQGTPAEILACPESLTGCLPVRAPRDPDAGRARATEQGRASPARRHRAQPQGHRRRDPAGRAHGRSPACRGSGKSSLVTDTLAPALTNKLHRARRRTGEYRAHRRARAHRQGHRHRPVARSAARRAPTRRPTRACGTTSARCSRRRPRPRRAATPRAASPSTSPAAAARRARATGRSRSRCTSCPTSTCRARSARARATTARRCRSPTRARTSPTSST